MVLHLAMWPQLTHAHPLFRTSRALIGPRHTRGMPAWIAKIMAICRKQNNKGNTHAHTTPAIQTQHPEVSVTCITAKT